MSSDRVRMGSLVVLFLVGTFAIVNCAQCPKTCSRRERYYTSCGVFSWSRCSRYRTVTYTCYETCEHGGWSGYSVKSEGACSVSCGGGTKRVTYQRSCTNPTPFNGGNDCVGASQKTENVACNSHNCPIDGVWSDFALSTEDQCSVTCGGGVKQLVFTRSCSEPAPQYGGRDCDGSDTDIRQQDCNTQHCPIDGVWSDFALSTEGQCSLTCGGGVKQLVFTRSCSEPAPQYGGRDCDGSDTDIRQQDCNTQHCPIDGVWSDFALSTEGQCSVTCGGGVKELVFTRSCSEPAPQYGGRDCDGSDTDIRQQDCNTHHCPIDGVWSGFALSTEGQCSVTCGGGVKQLVFTRSCSEPAPQYGGRDCDGSDTDIRQQDCNTQHCPIDGVWSDFALSTEGQCSVTCGGGVKQLVFTRSCSEPAPQYGGRDCEGSDTDIRQQDCNTHHCPIDGVWSDFALSTEGQCSVTCGGGVKQLVFTRSCSEPAPQYGGRDCDGSDTDMREQDCNTHHCPIDGGWTDFTEWKDYDECTALCGGGTKDQWRSRTCTNPTPAYGGKSCEGELLQNQTVACNEEDCGDQCPKDHATYIDNVGTPGRYYQCDHGVARLKECAENTRWDQNSTACVHVQDQQKAALKAGDECDPAILYNYHPDCTKFIMCINGRALEMSCSPGTRFNYALSACDFEANVPCPTA